MLGKSAQMLLMLVLMCGLCAPAPANTTADGIVARNFADRTAVPAPLEPMAPPIARTRIALLLPLESARFGVAAQAVRAGFLAAHEREPEGLEVTVLDSADGPQQALLAYDDALAHHDIVVGPLARADVAAIAQSGKVSKPTLALAQPEVPVEEAIALPPQMLAIGLSIEDEARQLANWAGAGRKHRKAFVISTHIDWQRRAARAFAAEWQALGQDPQQIDIITSGGYIGANSLAQMKQRLREEKPALLFFALDAFQARQLQQALGKGNLVYGTSQLNPLAASDWRTAEPWPEMNGVRLLDIPWLLQPDHPAVMVYPRQVPAADRRTNPDLARLYALGIDAFRIARELAAQRTGFELDGVSGRLSVRFGKGAARFQRRAQPAVYQDGIVTPFLSTH